MNPQMLAFDIETSGGFSANFGRVLCCCFGPLYADKIITMRGDSKKYQSRRYSDDSKLVLDIKQQLESAWMWLTWYGKGFDIPFLNGRLALAGIPPIEKRLHLDLMYYAGKFQIRFNNRRLATVARSFKFKEQKFDLDNEEWVDSTVMNKAAMNKLVLHCIQDVKLVKEAFPILAPFVANIHK